MAALADTEWHGTPDEGQALNEVISYWCKTPGEGQHCEFGPMGMRTSTCAAHAMLLEQRCLDGLLFMHRKKECLMREEGLDEECSD